MWPRHRTTEVSADDDDEEEEAGMATDEALYVAVAKKEDKEYEVWFAAVTKDTCSGVPAASTSH